MIAVLRMSARVVPFLWMGLAIWFACAWQLAERRAAAAEEWAEAVEAEATAWLEEMSR